LIIDDVITAGTAIGEAMEIIKSNNADVSGVIVAVDRQEKAPSGKSAIQEVEEKYGIRVISIISLAHLIDFLKDSNGKGLLSRIENYRSTYGI